MNRAATTSIPLHYVNGDGAVIIQIKIIGYEIYEHNLATAICMHNAHCTNMYYYSGDFHDFVRTATGYSRR